MNKYKSVDEFLAVLTPGNLAQYTKSLVWVALGLFVAVSAAVLHDSVPRNLVFGALFALVGVLTGKLCSKFRLPIVLTITLCVVLPAILLALSLYRVYSEGFAVFG